MTAIRTSVGRYSTLASIRPVGSMPLEHSISVTMIGIDIDSRVGVNLGSRFHSAGNGRLSSGFGSVPFVSTKTVVEEGSLEAAAFVVDSAGAEVATVAFRRI